MPVKKEFGSDDDDDDANETRTFKKRKYSDTVDESSDVGEATGSELAKLAQAGLDEEIIA